MQRCSSKLRVKVNKERVTLSGRTGRRSAGQSECVREGQIS